MGWLVALSITKKKQFPNVHVAALYALVDGGVQLTETWTYPTGESDTYVEEELWHSGSPESVALHHDWDLYVEAEAM